MKRIEKDFMRSDFEVFNENNETEVYFNPFQYFSNFRWFAYERIWKYIVRKWSSLTVNYFVIICVFLYINMLNFF